MNICHECLGHGIEPPVYDNSMAGLMLTSEILTWQEME